MASWRQTGRKLAADPTLSSFKQEISNVKGYYHVGETPPYFRQDKLSSFSKLKELVGRERIKRDLLALRAAGTTVPAKRAASEQKVIPATWFSQKG